MSRGSFVLATTMLLALGSPLAMAQSTAADRALWDLEASTVEHRDCKASSMPRCWYLFFAINEAPVRQLWMLDLKVRNPEPGNANLLEMDVAHLHESDDPAEPGANDFLLYTLQFKCKEKKYRIANGYALLIDGSVDQAKQAFPWHDGFENSWFGLAGKAACQKSEQLRPTAYNMVFLGDFYRPVDAADVTRRFLWTRR
ncbi:hypothetical protein [Arenimonas oryziterrae]|uniref:Uncharacterized protein n=1 Tax=Arenimonas oryziterrae DSM 21050 = YC6267 TaxID=1121015 RepID=A0A091AM39_9GAMM|nr:hypothetical protein [Arenimonas oryziterrae]KFN41263.1 hypothetical protein N789_05075 [Arenimonas oryziterrae DSM 21050 = YC6267]